MAIVNSNAQSAPKGTTLQRLQDLYNGKESAVESTWAPVIHLPEGGFIFLRGGMSYGDAMKEAERIARTMPGVDTISAMLERGL